MCESIGSTLLEFRVAQKALAIVAAHADPQHAERAHDDRHGGDAEPMTHASPIEALQHCENGHHQRLAKSRVEAGDPQQHFEDEQGDDRRPVADGDQAPQHQVQQAEPDVRRGDDRLREGRVIPRRLLNGADNADRDHIRNDQRFECERVLGASIVGWRAPLDQPLTGRKSRQHREQHAEADDDHGAIVAVERRLQRPVRRGHVKQPDRDRRPLQRVGKGEHRRPLLGAQDEPSGREDRDTRGDQPVVGDQPDSEASEHGNRHEGHPLNKAHGSAAASPTSASDEARSR